MSSQIFIHPVDDGDSDAAIRVPRRTRGQLRVEALLAAASNVFAEKGYAAATMTAIAAGSGSSIGSLYQFFKTKEAVAEAVLRVQVEALWARFEALAARAGALSADELGRAFAGLLAGFRADHPSFARLVEAPEVPVELLASVSGVRRRMREHVVAILQRHAPGGDAARFAVMAPAIQQAMKAAVQLQAEFTGDERAAAMGELEEMLAGYLVARLGA